MEYVPVPMEILMYREKLGLGKVNEKEKMPIGDFTIELENVRLGLLFQSQINQDRGLLEEYCERGINLLGVVDDVPTEMVSMSYKKTAQMMY